jgi:small subunit ribosomal protein S16
VAVKIRLKRMGKIRAPFYRVVVMDSRTKRDGRAIEEIGKYHPTAEPSVIDIDSARAQHWLSTGAQPTEAVEALFKVTGDWQTFKGLPGAEGTLKVAEPKRSKREAYEAAVAAAGGSTLDTTREAPARKKAAPAAKTAAPAESPARTATTASTTDASTSTDTSTAPGTPADAVASDTPAQTAEETPVETPSETSTDTTAAPAADTDSGSASAESTDSSDDPGATTAAETSGS